MEVQLHAFLISTLDGGECSALRPSRFTARERVPVIHWIGGWVDPRAVLDDVKYILFALPYWGLFLQG